MSGVRKQNTEINSRYPCLNLITVISVSREQFLPYVCFTPSKSATTVIFKESNAIASRTKSCALRLQKVLSASEFWP